MGAQRGAQEADYQTLLDAQRANEERMIGVRDRLFGLYGVDFTDITNHSAYIDTTTLSLEEVADEIMRLAHEIQKKTRDLVSRFFYMRFTKMQHG